MLSRTIFARAFLFAAAILTILAMGAAADSATVSYQGVLRDAALNPVADGGYAMEFEIYDSDTGGASLWGPEHYPSVATNNGRFSVYLGSILPLGTLFADHAMLWLEISADTGPGMEAYAPRVPLASVPYAQHALHAATADQAGNADNLGGQPSSAYAEAGHAHAGSDITSGTVPFPRLPVGGGSSQVAPGNHTHTLNALSDVSAASPSAGHALTWNGSNWQAIGGYAFIRDQRSGNAGDSVVGWQTRTLNTIDSTIPGLTLSNNRVNMPAGRYWVTASAPVYRSERHQIVLYNTTSNSVQLVGSSAYAYNTTESRGMTHSHLEGVLVLSSPALFEIRHHVTMAKDGNNGLGLQSNTPDVPNIYTRMSIRKF